MEYNKDTPSLTVSCYQLLKPAKSIKHFTSLSNHSLHKPYKYYLQWLKASNCVLHWFMILEEYGVLFEYLPGKKNVVVYDLS
jgi:hypothetical protein